MSIISERMSHNNIPIPPNIRCMNARIPMQPIRIAVCSVIQVPGSQQLYYARTLFFLSRKSCT